MRSILWPIAFYLSVGGLGAFLGHEDKLSVVLFAIAGVLIVIAARV